MIRVKREQAAVSSGFNSRSLTFALPVILALLFFVQSLSAFDFSPPYTDVTAWIEGNTVRYRVYDSSRGQWMEDYQSIGGHTISNLTTTDGVVTWLHGDWAVYYAVYDPSLGKWVEDYTPTHGHTISNLTTTDGVVAWLHGDWLVYYAVYDPSLGKWEEEYTPAEGHTIFNLTTNDGVVAWLHGDWLVYYAVYDPSLGKWEEEYIPAEGHTIFNLTTSDGVVAWLHGDWAVYNVVYDLSRGRWMEDYHSTSGQYAGDIMISYGTVYWTLNGNQCVGGYDHISGSWNTNPTVPLASFMASSVWEGSNGDYWVHFSDMSLGVDNYSWTFGDGGYSSLPSPLHVYQQSGIYIVNLDVYGPGGYDADSQIVIVDLEAPTGGIVINNDAEETYSTAVTLTLSAVDDSGSVASMRFSNDNSVWSGWEQYNSTKTWALSPGYGVKTVYAQFQDAAGNISTTVYDTITWPEPPSITVTAPNGGETWYLGETVTINWDYISIASTELVRLVLLQNDTVLAAIADNITIGDRSYAWTVGAHNGGTAAPGADYKIRVETMSGSYYDESNNTFTVAPPSLAVTSPNGGEEWLPGSTHDITWTSDHVGGDVAIELYKNNVLDTTLGTAPAADGVFSWETPMTTTLGNDYQIRVYQGTVEDYSDADFSFIAQNPEERPDFNLDGHADILWRNNVTGENKVWIMNGTTLVEERSLNTMLNPDWDMAGTGDFNGDGHVDILWRSTSLGLNMFWAMEGFKKTATVWLDVLRDEEWDIKGTGDFNGDGKVDILWRNNTSGENKVWAMDGSVLIEEIQLNTLNNPDWDIKGAGDFNGDGKVDILWRDKVAGYGLNMTWAMDGTSKIETLWLQTLNNPDWDIVGAGDFNGDGKVDILWRDRVAGYGLNMFWALDGLTKLSTEWLDTYNDPDWEIKNN